MFENRTDASFVCVGVYLPGLEKFRRQQLEAALFLEPASRNIQ